MHLEDTISDTKSSEEFAQALAAAALGKKAVDLVILDMRGLIDFSDYFVLCTAQNTRQVRAIAEEVKMVSKKNTRHPCWCRGSGCVPMGAGGLQRCGCARI